MRASRRRSAALGATAVAAIAFGVLAAPAVPALAHNSVIAESPEADSTITAQPDTVWLETSDALLDVEGATVMDVVGPDGLHYATDCPAVEGAVASVPAELGPDGVYTVAWRVVSADGHPITGEFEFTWTPADGQTVAVGADEAACSSGAGESAEPGDAVGEPGDDATDAAASGGVGDLVWVVGGAVVVGLAGLAAFLLTRRRPAPGGAAGGDTPGGDTTGRDTADHEADPVDPDRPADR